jgi:hypothetical protein
MRVHARTCSYMLVHANIRAKTTTHSHANARAAVSIASRVSYSDILLKASTAVTTLIIECSTII